MKSLPLILFSATALLMTMTHCAIEEEVKPQAVEEDTVAAISVTDITPYSAHIEGQFGAEDDTSEIAGIKYSLQNTRYLSTTGDEIRAKLVSKGKYELDIDGLYSDTTYYFVTYVERNGTRYNSDTYKFRTHRLSASTNEVENIYAYGVQLGLTLSEEIDPKKFKGSYGIYYGLKSRVIRESSTLLNSPYSIDGLLPNHDYYYAAFVCQKTAGLRDVYIWGETIKFTTPDIVAATFEPEDITTYSAHLKGSIDVRFKDTKDIGFLLFERNRDVTLDSTESTSDQKILKLAANEKAEIGYGDFALKYNNLKANKKYYCRAYAVVNAKSGNNTSIKAYYGDIIEFHTPTLTIATDKSADIGLSVIWATANYGATSPQKLGNTYTPQEAQNMSFEDGWRLPTLAEAQELVDSCHWSWRAYQSVYGAAVTDATGLSIFLPANMKVGSSYTYGVYMVNDTIDEKGRISSFRFVQDIENELECQKTTNNKIDSDAQISIRLVKDK